MSETQTLDKNSFMLGMVAAFCQSVAAGSKPMAFSPPMTKEEYQAISDQAYEIIQLSGLRAYYEPNDELPLIHQRAIIVIYQSPEQIMRYDMIRRAKGASPLVDFAEFAELLGYGPGQARPGYDAMRALFED